MFRSVDCPVIQEDPFGVYANSFRISEDGTEVLLDFCLYSEAENKARVVSRVRVSPSLLAVVQAKIGQVSGSYLTEGCLLLFLVDPGIS